MDRFGFERLVGELGAAWTEGDAKAAAACFSADVDYSDPRRYRFTSRDQLLPFFAPGPGGHAVTWHRLLFDEAAQTGVIEYTYVGHHRYHGAAIVEVDEDGRVSRWREWQHRADEYDWADFVAGRSVAE